MQAVAYTALLLQTVFLIMLGYIELRKAELALIQVKGLQTIANKLQAIADKLNITSCGD